MYICRFCGLIHMPYEWGISHPNAFNYVNLLEAKYVKRIKEEEREQEKKRLEQEAEERRREEFERKKREEAKRQNEQIAASALYDKYVTEEGAYENIIRVKDFVVRRSTFKCRKKDHSIQEIDAIIGIIDRNGDVKQRTVTAGYCPICNVYFILESTYQNLKTYGTPICRVSDEKSYLNGSVFVNDMKLAQQSVLMQHGYNVSQEEGLSAARRQ